MDKDDYKEVAVRNDAKFNQNYLRGHYGGVPYISKLEDVMDAVYGK